jgi:hypothetical protein
MTTKANELDFSLDGSPTRSRRAKPQPIREKSSAGLAVRNRHVYLGDEELPDDATLTITAGQYARIVGTAEQLALAMKLKLDQEAGLQNVKMILRDADGKVLGLVERKLPPEVLAGAIETTIRARPRPS